VFAGDEVSPIIALRLSVRNWRAAYIDFGGTDI